MEFFNIPNMKLQETFIFGSLFQENIIDCVPGMDLQDWNAMILFVQFMVHSIFLIWANIKIPWLGDHSIVSPAGGGPNQNLLDVDRHCCISTKREMLM